MWKANGKTTTLQLFLDSLSPKIMRDSLSGDKLKNALFGDLSLEEAMDLSQDRQILELEETGWVPEPLWKLWKREKSYLAANQTRALTAVHSSNS
jgi:hypothetical protein